MFLSMHNPRGKFFPKVTIEMLRRSRHLVNATCAFIGLGFAVLSSLQTMI